MIHARHDNWLELSALTQAADDLSMAVFDRDLILIEAHHTLVAMSGHNADTLLGRPLSDLAPTLAPLIEPWLRAVRDTGEAVVAPLTVASSMRDAPWCLRYQPVRSHSGVVVAIEIFVPAALLSKWPNLAGHHGSANDGVASTPIDLVASARRWRDLLSNVEHGFCIFKMLYNEEGVAVDYRFLEVNSTFEHHTGLNEAVGKTARELVPELEDSWVKTYARVAETGERLRFEQSSAAMGRWFEVEAVRVGAAANREVALLFTDITARKRAEADAGFRSEVSEQIRAATNADLLLWRATEMLGHHLKVTRCCMIEVDEANDRWLIKHEYLSTSDLPPNTGTYAISPYPDSLVAALRVGRVAVINDTITDPQTAATDATGFQRLGTRAFIAAPLLDSGRLVGACVAFSAEPRAWEQREIALLEAVSDQAWNEALQLRSQERLQEALKVTEAALDQAREATRERDLLISIAAHDLRSPLTVILGQAQLLQRRAARAGLEERDQRTVDAISEQAVRLNHMIGALLDLSRIQEGRLTIEPQLLDLTALIERAIFEIRSMVTVHQLVLQAPTDVLMLHADPIRLEQVFSNLLGNAVKYSPDGGIITVTLAKEGANARVTICDQGIGIPAEAMPHLFTRFYRAPNATAQATSSMGVGLFVVRELVQAHGGTVRAESVEGQGSSFIVELPIMADA